jgi:replication fork protection complex subunit Csm3/Swi3
MPSKTNSKPAAAPTAEPDSTAFINDYLADWDDDDPFRSVSPEPAQKKNDQAKRKATDALGIDEQIDLTKKPRAPRVKLDETLFVFFQL